MGETYAASPRAHEAALGCGRLVTDILAKRVPAPEPR
jgi:hypothetical protein